MGCPSFRMAFLSLVKEAVCRALYMAGGLFLCADVPEPVDGAVSKIAGRSRVGSIPTIRIKRA